jgi:hypothetical protein
MNESINQLIHVFGVVVGLPLHRLLLEIEKTTRV